ncbi:hypothetical protein [Arachidicoccus sp.]|uniref:hypothetical protein n=1 Tax=Arachidicoccus sp. TaxID=1872624 RepID=UPI003D1BC3C4
MNKLKHALTCLLSFYTISVIAQQSDSTKPQIGKSPLIFVDSVQFNRTNLTKIKPGEIADITVLSKKNAVDRFGEKAKDGVIYIETKTMAKSIYWRFLKSKSEDFTKDFPTPESDSLAQYIVDDKVLNLTKDNHEGTLTRIIRSNRFKAIKIITKTQLVRDYNVNGKQYGVLITTTRP